MKSIFIFICSIILPIFSLKIAKPKLCINCKHFITDDRPSEFGKCSLFFYNNMDYNNKFLVNGIPANNDEKYLHYYCCTARNYNDLCGQEGKMFKRKYVKKSELKNDEVN